MRVMIVAGAIGSLLALLAAAPASAQMLSNVQGPAGGQLAGMTCSGTLQDRAQANYHGAIRITFAESGGALTAHLYGTLGEDAFKNAASPTTELGDQGAVSDLQVKGDKVTFKSIRGALYQLTYKDGSLNGVDVPTSHAPTEIATHCEK
jgi:hypothetical protein